MDCSALIASTLPGMAKHEACVEARGMRRGADAVQHQRAVLILIDQVAGIAGHAFDKLIVR